MALQRRTWLVALFAVSLSIGCSDDDTPNSDTGFDAQNADVEDSFTQDSTDTSDTKTAFEDFTVDACNDSSASTPRVVIFADSLSPVGCVQSFIEMSSTQATSIDTPDGWRFDGARVDSSPCGGALLQSEGPNSAQGSGMVEFTFGENGAPETATFDLTLNFPEDPENPYSDSVRLEGEEIRITGCPVGPS